MRMKKAVRKYNVISYSFSHWLHTALVEMAFLCMWKLRNAFLQSSQHMSKMQCNAMLENLKIHLFSRWSETTCELQKWEIFEYSIPSHLPAVDFCATHLSAMPCHWFLYTPSHVSSSKRDSIQSSHCSSEELLLHEHDIIFQLRQHISKMHLHSWSGMNFILLRRINCCLLLLVLRTMSLRASFLLSMACFCLLTDAYALLNRPDSARHFPMADDAYRWRIHICYFPFLCVFQCNNITFANNNMKLHIRVLPLRLIGFGWFWVSARQNRQQQIW